MQVNAGMVSTAISALAFWMGDRLLAASGQRVLDVRSAFRQAASFAGTLFWLAESEYQRLPYHLDSGEADALFRAARYMEECIPCKSTVIEINHSLRATCAGMERIAKMGEGDELPPTLVCPSVRALSLYFGELLLVAQTPQAVATAAAGMEKEWPTVGTLVRAATVGAAVPPRALHLQVLKPAADRLLLCSPRPAGRGETLRYRVRANSNDLDAFTKMFAGAAVGP